ncbi:hypothetical protein HaLaN_23565 [Haematococcus lacustris]|uniref:Uncharacterized protein n=1 Tax=Haematococcus lacustris TaxID=44745 RepID=A0A6A0A058_HAELA|nr:hypothetical protein HaLaN_23565 [Haematococcus lacustris]
MDDCHSMNETPVVVKKLPKPSQHHSQAGGARLSCATGQIRQLCQPRARSTLAWATSGCETDRKKENYSGTNRRALRQELPPVARPAPTSKRWTQAGHVPTKLP